MSPCPEHVGRGYAVPPNLHALDPASSLESDVYSELACPKPSLVVSEARQWFRTAGGSCSREGRQQWRRTSLATLVVVARLLRPGAAYCNRGALPGASVAATAAAAISAWCCLSCRCLPRVTVESCYIAWRPWRFGEALSSHPHPPTAAAR